MRSCKSTSVNDLLRWQHSKRRARFHLLATEQREQPRARQTRRTRRASYRLVWCGTSCARLNDATEETRQMRDALLFMLITGVVVLAVGVDIGMVLAWLRRRWP